MKKIVLTLVTLLSMTTAMAQSDNQQQKANRPEPKQPTPEMMVERMAKELNLTDDQKTKVLDLNKEYEARMKKILSADQYKQYQQMRHPRGGRPGGQKGGRRGFPPGEQRMEQGANK